MKKIINAFPIPIFETLLDNHESINSSLIIEIRKLFSNMNNKRILSSAWHNGVFSRNNEPLGYSSFNDGDLTENPNFEFFYSDIRNRITEFFQQLHCHNSWSFTNSWTNVYPEGAFVPLHHHGNVHWSGVYYVKADPGCGDLLLVDPKEYSLNNEPSNTDGRGVDKMTINAIPGKLFLWPGYLKHETQPNHSGTDRIVISFNVNINDQL